MKNKLEENLPYSLLRLGLKCNANCLFCNVPPEFFEFSEEPSTQQAKKEIKNLTKLNQQVRLSLTGGEPTLRLDLPELIKHAKENKIKIIEIQTNALILADEEYVRRLREAGLNKAFVGLHSHLPQIHDYLVGLRGAFRKCLAGIKNLIKEDIEVILNPVITTKSYKTLPGFVKFIKKEIPEVQCLSLSVVQPRGRAWINKEIVPRYRIISPYIEKALALGKRFGIIINNPYCGLPFCIGGWWRYLDQCVEFSEKYLEKNKKNLIKSYTLPAADKIKSPKCLLCDLDEFCNGVWREYAQIHSLSDLTPIHLRPRGGVAQIKYR